jgi:hypothetical protein
MVNDPQPSTRVGAGLAYSGSESVLFVADGTKSAKARLAVRSPIGAG